MRSPAPRRGRRAARGQGTGCAPLFFTQCYAAHRDLHSFPTRRSSDLSSFEQLLTVECGVGAEGEQACHKKAQYDAADDAAPACDQPESGNGSSGHCQGNGSPKRTRSEEHTSELQSLAYLVCRLLLEKK